MGERITDKIQDAVTEQMEKAGVTQSVNQTSSFTGDATDDDDIRFQHIFRRLGAAEVKLQRCTDQVAMLPSASQIRSICTEEWQRRSRMFNAPGHATPAVADDEIASATQDSIPQIQNLSPSSLHIPHEVSNQQDEPTFGLANDIGVRTH